MKVFFISDFDLTQHSGGAQVSNDLIIKKGRELGHDITLQTYSSPIENFYKDYDVVVSSNLEALSQQYENIIQVISNHQYHVRLEHDSCMYLSDEKRKQLFSEAKKTFFLSQFHADYFKEYYGNYFHDIKIVYDPIDPLVFFEKEGEKEYDIVYCGFLHVLKGSMNLVKFAQSHPDRRIDVFGWGNKNVFSDPPKNMVMHGKVEHGEVPNIFRKAKYVYHNPVVNEPFCRMVGEALLCGCGLIGAPQKIGSYLEFEKVGREQFAENCKNAPNEFWKEIEKK